MSIVKYFLDYLGKLSVYDSNAWLFFIYIILVIIAAVSASVSVKMYSKEQTKKQLIIKFCLLLLLFFVGLTVSTVAFFIVKKIFITIGWDYFASRFARIMIVCFAGAAFFALLLSIFGAYYVYKEYKNLK